jgi:hypothetical protein
MGTIFTIFIVSSLFFILYLRYKEGSNDHLKIGKGISTLKTSSARIKKMIESEDDEKSVDELQSSLEKLTKRLEHNTKLLDELNYQKFLS